MQTVGATRHCWFYHTWQLWTSIIAHFASWKCRSSHLAFWLYHRVICGRITYTTLLAYCGSLFAFIHTWLHPQAQFTLSLLIPRWVPSVCLTMWAQTRLTRLRVHPLWLRLSQWVPWAGLCWRCRCPSEPNDSETMLRQSTGLNTQHRRTHASPVSQPASRRFIVQHQRINFPELCRLVSTKLFSWLHPLCNLWVSQGAVWRGTWKSYNNKICSSLR